jgi:tripartite-type tricarboxylate transporter receptor subunit TctC
MTSVLARSKSHLNFLAAVAVGLCVQGHSASAAEPPFPSKPITVIVSVGAGGPTDAVARRIMQEVSVRIGQPVVVENRPGGNGMVATRAVAQAPADGYTYAVVLAAYALNPSLYNNLAYEPSAVTGVSMLGKYPMLLVASGTLPFDSVAALQQYAKSTPGTLNYASSGQGSLTHLSMERLSSQLGTPFVHVPYRGNNQAMVDLFEGRLALTFDTLLLSEQHVKSGKLKALAITGDTRSPILPGVPTIREAGYPELETYGWIAVIGNSKAPAAATASFSREIDLAAKNPEVKKQLDANSLQDVGGTPLQTNQFLQSETVAWKKVIDKAGFKLD